MTDSCTVTDCSIKSRSDNLSVLPHIRAVAFDLDGTLVDSLPGLAAAVDQMLLSCGLPVAGESQVSLWIGNGADVLVQRALIAAGRDPSPDEQQRARHYFDLAYQQTAASGTQLFPQVLRVLTQLKKQAIPLGLITNKPTPFVAPLLASLGLEHYFSVIIGGDDVAMKKPHPAPLYLMLAKLGLHANELLFVGDSRNDIQAAQAAGCPVIGLTYGYNYGEPISLSQPDKVFTHFADLLPVIGLPPLKDQDVSHE